MKKTISLVLVLALGLVTEVANADFTFGTPTNLGPKVNSSANEFDPGISADELEIFYHSERSGGYGNCDLWFAIRANKEDAWEEAVYLGSDFNTWNFDGTPCISADGLVLYFSSNGRIDGLGYCDIWKTSRPTRSEPWGPPENLGPVINTSANESHPYISSDGLSLYFAGAIAPGDPPRPGGYGGGDIWLTERQTGRQMTELVWGTPINLGDTINSSVYDAGPCLSADGLMLFFHSDRTGGYGNHDIWVARRKTPDDPWEEPLNLGPPVNTSAADAGSALSGDGKTLYFFSGRTGGSGAWDLWQVPIIPIVDLNRNGIVDSADMCIIVDHWGEDYSLCDIGPMPWGDGIVDVQDLIVLAEHLFEGIPPVEPEEVNVDEGDAGSQVELEIDQILVVTLESNPTTGYRWEQAETQEFILEQMGEAEFKPSDTGEPPLVGAGGWEIFRFKAISAGQMNLQLVYHRAWEEGVEPLKTFSLQVVVR